MIIYGVFLTPSSTSYIVLWISVEFLSQKAVEHRLSKPLHPANIGLFFKLFLENPVLSTHNLMGKNKAKTMHMC